MNILFVFNTDISPSAAGGATAMTHVVVEGLSKYHRCSVSLAYFKEHCVPSPIENKFKIKDTNIDVFEKFLLKNKVETVVVSLILKDNLWFLPKLYAIAQKHGIKVIRWQHFMPGEEYAYYGSFSRFIYALKTKKDIIRQLFYLFLTWFRPVLTPLCTLYLRKKYVLNYKYSDAMVLLSERFFETYTKIANLKNTDKFYSIGNTNTLPETISLDKLRSKEKIVLMVSRMDEPMKRISIALKIWKRIEKTGRFNDWKMIICGRGEDLEYVRYLHRRLKIKSCNVAGYIEEKPYAAASLFMMTSAFEGWGLTLTESLQMGVVPIAFDSYGSVYDIINNGEDGLIVPNNKTGKFVDALISLMENDDLRLKMAKNALESSKRFEQKKIIDKWMQLILKLNR